MHISTRLNTKPHGLQVFKNFAAKSTGTLSGITAAINVVGCLVRVFTTLQAKAGAAMLRSYLASECRTDRRVRAKGSTRARGWYSGDVESGPGSGRARGRRCCEWQDGSMLAWGGVLNVAVGQRAQRLAQGAGALLPFTHTHSFPFGPWPA